MQVPGIGVLTAMLLLTEIGDIKRFKTLGSTYCSYLGIIPSTNSSGELEQVGEMTRRGNKWLRTALIESSWIAMRKDPALLSTYVKHRQIQRGGKSKKTNKAIVKVCRRLLSKIRFVWINQQEYQLGYN